MRMFSVADQRSIPEIDVDTVIAVPCRELLLTDDGRGSGPAELVADRPATTTTRVTGGVGDMLAKLAEGIPVDGMEALLPVLRPDELTLLTDHLPEGTPVLVCDPEKVRTRAADLIKTGREFLEASWSVAAIGGDAPDRPRSSSAGPASANSARCARRRGRRPPVVDAEPAGDESAVELDIRPAPSARGQQMQRRRDLRHAARARRHRWLRRRRRPRAPAPRTASSSSSANPTPRQRMLEPGDAPEAGCRRRAQGPAARRRGDARRQPGRHHRDRSDRQPGRRHRRQAAGGQASQRRRPAGADRRRPGGARSARHRPVRRDDRAHRRRRAPRVPGAGVRVGASGAAGPTSCTCRWTRWTSCRATSAVRRPR